MQGISAEVLMEEYSLKYLAWLRVKPLAVSLRTMQSFDKTRTNGLIG